MKIRYSTLFTSLASAVTLISMAAAPIANAAVMPASIPSIYFAQSTVSAPDASTVSLPVRLSATDANVNAVDVTVHFPAGQLSFTGVNKSGSYFDTFLPANVKATDGVLNFSAAKLSSTEKTPGNVLIATLNFTAKAATGSAEVSLTGSQAANKGTVVDNVATPSTTVQFTAASSTNPSNTIGISGIAASGVTLSGGTITWKTAVPASSSVDYGSNSSYGLTAGSTDLTTDHSVSLAADFAGKSAVHYRVSSANAAGVSQTSGDHSFTTLGYAVRIHVTDPNGKSQSGINVTIEGSTAKTNNGGYVTITNVSAGSQKVSIGDTAKNITVKPLKDADAAATPQQFTLAVKAASLAGLYVGLGILVLLVISLGAWLYWIRTHTKPTVPTTA